MRVPSVGPAPTVPGLPPPVSKPTAAGHKRPFTEVLGEQPGAKPLAPTRSPLGIEAARSTAASKAEAGAGVRGLLERAVSAENRVDALVRAAASGKTFSPAELLALQASVFRYSQTVEVVSRVADRLVGAIKQTIGTSV
jgi:hypothetical protein